MMLSEALNHLKPCYFLKQVQPGTETKPGVYCIDSFPDPEVSQDPSKMKAVRSDKKYKHAGRGKQVHLTTANNATTHRHHLRTAYNFLLGGSRIEFHLHQKLSIRCPTVDWALAHCLHLRPDAILAAMPEGTTTLALPATSDLSFKSRMPKQASAITSQVMWALENADALKRRYASTPARIKAVGKWPDAPRSKDDAWLGDVPTDIDLDPEAPFDNSPLTLDFDPDTPP